MNVGQVFATIMLGGLMGLFGQGIRTIVGLKTMVDYASDQQINEKALFSAARILISLVIGFLAGMAATLILGLDVLNANAGNLHTLLGIAAAGYAGTDFIEGFISKYLPAGKVKDSGDISTPADQLALKNSLTALIGKIDNLAHVVAKPPDGKKPIAKSEIDYRFLQVLNAGANVLETDKISKYRYGEDINFDLAQECNAAPAFKADGLNLQKADVERLSTVKDFCDCIATWYGKHNWNVTNN